MTNTTEFIQMYLSEQSKWMGFLAVLVAVAIGVVTVIFAIGAFLVWKQNRDIWLKAKNELDQAAIKRQQINSWFDEKKQSVDLQVKGELDEFGRKLEEMRNFQTVVMALSADEYHVALIYPPLCALAERPCALYVGLFRKIVRLNINQDITDRARHGLDLWEQMQQDWPGNGRLWSLESATKDLPNPLFHIRTRA